MPRSKEVRDPVHGMVELRPEEWAAIDTAAFQRLRRIRQLAMTHLVYPGAVHTRFEHSLGVRHVAGRLAEKLRIRGDERRAVETAALLHDIGHGPFSHVSEQVIDELAGVEGVHEAVSAFLIRNDDDLRAELDRDVCDRAAEFIDLTGDRSAARDIVSGPTDGDKLDYLLRDSYFAGVKYGEFDLRKIIESALVIDSGRGQTQLGFDADGLWAVEGLLLARHHMHRQVYGHKTRLATDIMITRALRSAVKNNTVDRAAYEVETREVNGTQQVRVTQEFVDRYVLQTDEHVLDRMTEAPADSPEGDLSRRLRQRRLLRQTVCLRLDIRKQELGAFRYSEIIDREVLTLDALAQMESRIAGDLSLPPHLIAIHIDARTNPTYRSPSSPPGPKDVMMKRGKQQPALLHAESEIFRAWSDEGHVWAYLYTPALTGENDEGKAEELLWRELSGT